MGRFVINLNEPEGLALVKGQWKCAQGYVPGEANEGLISQPAGSPARLPDYDDSSWEVVQNLDTSLTRGFSFICYRLRFTYPETVDGEPIGKKRVRFETCVDDYGKVWFDGECDREFGAIQGFNRAQRVTLTKKGNDADLESSVLDAHPGKQHNIAILAANGPLAAPGGGVFVRYADLAFEWQPHH